MISWHINSRNPWISFTLNIQVNCSLQKLQVHLWLKLFLVSARIFFVYQFTSAFEMVVCCCCCPFVAVYKKNCFLVIAWPLVISILLITISGTCVLKKTMQKLFLHQWKLNEAQSFINRNSPRLVWNCTSDFHPHCIKISFSSSS